jgi:hypothetical protein
MKKQKEISQQEIGLSYMATNKEGTINDLMQQIDFETFNGFLATGFIKISGKHYSITDKGIESYNSFYRKPTFIERLKGLYCHYILGF